MARTMAELARAIGVSRPTVLDWTRHHAWPFGKSGPFDVAAVDAWRRETLRPTNEARAETGAAGAMSQKQLADLLHRKWQTRVLRLEFRKQRGELIERERAQAETQAALALFRQRLEDGPRQRSQLLDKRGLLADGKRQSVERVLADWVQSVLGQLTRDLESACKK